MPLNGLTAGLQHLPDLFFQPATVAASEISRPNCDAMKRLRDQYDLKPLVIHTNYLVNLAGTNELFLKKSVEAFRGEIERPCLVRGVPGAASGVVSRLGPGARLMRTAARSPRRHKASTLRARPHRLIENTAGAEYSLGGSFEQVAEMLQYLRNLVPVGACIDTVTLTSPATTLSAGRECRIHFVGSMHGRSQTGSSVALQRRQSCARIEARSSSAYRKGSIGLEPFRRLLNDARLAHAAFIAETPIDEPGDDGRMWRR